MWQRKKQEEGGEAPGEPEVALLTSGGLSSNKNLKSPALRPKAAVRGQPLARPFCMLRSNIAHSSSSDVLA